MAEYQKQLQQASHLHHQEKSQAEQLAMASSRAQCQVAQMNQENALQQSQIDTLQRQIEGLNNPNNPNIAAVRAECEAQKRHIEDQCRAELSSQKENWDRDVAEKQKGHDQYKRSAESEISVLKKQLDESQKKTLQLSLRSEKELAEVHQALKEAQDAIKADKSIKTPPTSKSVSFDETAALEKKIDDAGKLANLLNKQLDATKKRCDEANTKLGLADAAKDKAHKDLTDALTSVASIRADFELSLIHI